MNTGILEKLKKEAKSLLSGMGITQRPTNFIGLDIGLMHLRAVRIKKAGDEFAVQDTLITKVEELNSLCDKIHIKDEEELCVNFNIDSLIIKRVSMPVMPHEEMESALKWELKEQVGFDIDKAKVKFYVLGEKDSGDGTKKIELIAFAYLESDVESKVKELKQMGLNVQSVMPLDFAIARYINDSKIMPHGERAAIVDIGSVKTLISIIEKDKICFTREIPLGGDTITNAMTGVIISDRGRLELSKLDAENIKIEQGISSDIKMLSLIRPVLEKLINQIKGSLEYYEQHFNEAKIEKIILSGNGSRLKGLKEYIVKETGIEVLAILPEEAGAIGLALSRDFSLNMLPEEFRSEGRKALKRFSVTMIAFALGAMLLFSYVLLCMQVINLKKGMEIQKQHWDNILEIKILKDKMIAYSSVINTFSSGDINAGKTMKEISNLILPDISLDKFAIDSREPNIRINGVILNQDSLTGFMSKLESSSLFQNVKLSFSQENQGAGKDAVNFEIT